MPCCQHMVPPSPLWLCEHPTSAAYKISIPKITCLLICNWCNLIRHCDQWHLPKQCHFQDRLSSDWQMFIGILVGKITWWMSETEMYGIRWQRVNIYTYMEMKQTKFMYVENGIFPGLNTFVSHAAEFDGRQQIVKLHSIRITYSVLHNMKVIQVTFCS